MARTKDSYKSVDYSKLFDKKYTVLPDKRNLPIVIDEYNTLPTKLKDILYCCSKGRVIGYEKNRGTGRFSNVTANKIRDSFSPASIGEVTCYTEKDVHGKYMWGLSSFHGRMAGIIRKYNDGTLSRKELNMTIGIRVIPKDKFLETYMCTNDQARATTGNHIANPDFCLGKEIQDVLSLLDEDEEKLIPRSYYSAIACLVVALYSKRTKQDVFTDKMFEIMDWSDLYNPMRQIVAANVTKTCRQCKIRLYKREKEQIANVMKYICTYIKELIRIEETNTILKGQKVRSKCMGVGMIGLIGTDILFCSTSKKPQNYPKQPVKLAKKVVASIDVLPANIKNLCKGNKNSMEQAICAIRRKVKK